MHVADRPEKDQEIHEPNDRPKNFFTRRAGGEYIQFVQRLGQERKAGVVVARMKAMANR